MKAGKKKPIILKTQILYSNIQLVTLLKSIIQEVSEHFKQKQHKVHKGSKATELWTVEMRSNELYFHLFAFQIIIDVKKKCIDQVWSANQTQE